MDYFYSVRQLRYQFIRATQFSHAVYCSLRLCVDYVVSIFEVRYFNSTSFHGGIDPIERHTIHGHHLAARPRHTRPQINMESLRLSCITTKNNQFTNAASLEIQIFEFTNDLYKADKD